MLGVKELVRRWNDGELFDDTRRLTAFAYLALCLATDASIWSNLAALAESAIDQWHTSWTTPQCSLGSVIESEAQTPNEIPSHAGALHSSPFLEPQSTWSKSESKEEPLQFGAKSLRSLPMWRGISRWQKKRSDLEGSSPARSRVETESARRQKKKGWLIMLRSIYIFHFLQPPERYTACIVLSLL